jgi:signal transduction histidine kinase
MNTLIVSINPIKKSVFNDIRTIGLNSIIFTVCALTVIWAIVSIIGVRSLIESRRTALQSMVESHQEEIASGQYRLFTEGMQRDRANDFSGVRICWGEAEINCEPTSNIPRPPFAFSIRIPVYAGDVAIATVEAYATLHSVLLQSALVLFSFIITIVIVFFSMRKFISSEQQARNALADLVMLTVQGCEVQDLNNIPGEIRPLAQALLEAVAKLQKVQIEKAEIEAEDNLAAQVAHDIRSPLAALDVALIELENLPEETRTLVRSATQRIRDIANNLLLKSNNKKLNPNTDNVSTKGVASIHHIASLLEAILSEKRIEYRKRSEINFEYLPDQETYTFFAEINVSEFNRVISNLINNSVEAIANNGHIQVSLTKNRTNLIVLVKDNGCGVNPEIIPRLGERGVTVGKLNKESGSGLGIFHAKSTLASWNGFVEITSKLNFGTSVSLTLPAAVKPAWFVKTIFIKSDQSVVVADDDPSIHQVWENRFKSAGVNARLTHLYTTDELFIWCNANSADLYLIDFEFAGSEESGLEIIEKLNLSKKSILVTSRHEEASIQKKCQNLKVGLIPKALASIVPIHKVVEGGSHWRGSDDI